MGTTWGTYENVRNTFLRTCLEPYGTQLGTQSGRRKHVHECMKMDENVCDLGYKQY
jgi:hypothetical protein